MGRKLVDGVVSLVVEPSGGNGPDVFFEAAK
jgi:hypothetical protein